MSFKISVIIPVYNAEKYLRKAVKSALIQPEVCEIILIEDKSPDNALAICKELEQEYQIIKLYQHPDKQNHGAGASRNLGVQKATGEYIAFLDADDYYLSKRFTNDLRILESDKTIDGVYNCLGVHIYEDSEAGRIHQKHTTMTKIIPPEELFENISPIGGYGYFHLDTLTVKKNVFKKTGLFNTTLEISQDTEIIIKMALLCKLKSGILNSPVAIRGVHSENRIKNQDKLYYYRPKLFKSLVEWSCKNDIKKDRIILLWKNWYKYYMKMLVTNKKYIRIKKLIFLLQSFIKMPFLIRKKLYLSQFPILHVIYKNS